MDVAQAVIILSPQGGLVLLGEKVPGFQGTVQSLGQSTEGGEGECQAVVQPDAKDSRCLAQGLVGQLLAGLQHVPCFGELTPVELRLSNLKKAADRPEHRLGQPAHVSSPGIVSRLAGPMRFRTVGTGEF